MQRGASRCSVRAGVDALSEVDGVVLAHWPEDRARGRTGRAPAHPRLFLVAAEAEPPAPSDDAVRVGAIARARTRHSGTHRRVAQSREPRPSRFRRPRSPVAREALGRAVTDRSALDRGVHRAPGTRDLAGAAREDRAGPTGPRTTGRSTPRIKALRRASLRSACASTRSGARATSPRSRRSSPTSGRPTDRDGRGDRSRDRSPHALEYTRSARAPPATNAPAR